MDKRISDHLWVAIIAGGNGDRMFPIGTRAKPKQFCQMDEDKTFIQAVAKTYLDYGVKPSQIVITTTDDNQARLAAEQTLGLGVLRRNIIQVENYGYPAAMYFASEFIETHDSEAVVINTPSDQYIEAGLWFSKALDEAVRGAIQGEAVIVGVKINNLNIATGCGHALFRYVRGARRYDVLGFVEKPNAKDAARIMKQDDSACNTGINVWKAETMLGAIRRHETKNLTTDRMMCRLGNLKVSVGSFKWYDCGTFQSLYDIGTKDSDGNVCLGGGTIGLKPGCCRSFFWAAGDLNLELYVDSAEDEAIVFNIVDNHPVLVDLKLCESQRMRILAGDYYLHKTFLDRDFSSGARNNLVDSDDIDNLIVGFMGVDKRCVNVRRTQNGFKAFVKYIY